MAYSNSSLVNYTRLSPNHSGLRNHSIDTITIHCVVGQLSVETLCNVFASTSAQASCNYGIGVDGRIALIVEEKNRSWCTSSSSNDNRAITIEVASDTFHPYAVNDRAYNSLINLCADICRRNGIKRLLWEGNKGLIGNVARQNMTVHRWFANKACPGDYLYNRHGDIAAKVNAKLGSGGTITPTPAPAPSTNPDTVTSFPATPFTVEVIVPDLNIRASASMSGAVKGVTGKGTFTITQVSEGWGKLKSGAGWIWLSNPSYCKVGKTVSGSSSAPAKKDNSFLVQVSVPDLRVRSGPGTNYKPTGKYTGIGRFTIVETKAGQGSTAGWGKLKSGAGWISLDYAKRV